MAYGEFTHRNPVLPLSPEGALPDGLVPVEAVAPGDLNPLVTADLHITVMGDLASVQVLRSELTTWLQERRTRDLGAFAITEGESIALTFSRMYDADAAVEQPSESEEDFQRRLDTTVYDTVVRLGEDPESRRFQNMMQRFAGKGIYTFRDMLVVGRTASGYAAHSTKAFAPIRQAVIETLPEEAESWKPRQNLAQAARICSDLSAVTAGVLGDTVMRPHHARWSVQDVLTRPAEELITVLWGQSQSDRYPEAARALQERARIYARDFLAAKQASQRRS